MISASLYTGVFYNVLLIVVIFVFIQAILYRNRPIADFSHNYLSAWGLFLAVIIYIGFRPIEYGHLGDTFTYNEYYAGYERGQEIPENADWLFHHLMKCCSSFVGVHYFFLLIAIIYVGCILKTCERLFFNNIFLSFLVCLTAFSFWGYGINGIRNGAASSVMLLTMTYYPNRIKLIIGGIISVGLHGSMVLPLFACILAMFCHRSKIYYWIWLGALLFSLLTGKYLMDYLMGVSFIDSRLSSYINNVSDTDLFSHTGFRWDFLLYSLPPILMGYYVVIKKKIDDRLYSFFLNVYLLSNAFWLLVIQIPYSNRFAYLSWFMYPVLLIYPFLRIQLWRQQYVKVAICLLCQFVFTYFMWIIGKL